MNGSEVAGMVAASESHGLITKKDALRFLTRRQLKRRLKTGQLIEAYPGVYRYAAAPQTWLQSLVALQNWATGLTFSHRTAAALHGFELFKEGPLELTATRRLRIPEGVTVYRVEVLLRSDVTEVRDLPVTKVPRTLIDLMCATDPYTLRSTIDQALRQKRTTLDELDAAAQSAKNRPGIRELRELLLEFSGDDGPTESVLEDRCLELIEASGLPRPRVQWSVVVGRKRRRLDLFFKEWGVLIEADGYASHSSVEVFEDDRQRNNSLVAANIRVLHWTWEAINERPEELITELYAVLNRHH